MGFKFYNVINSKENLEEIHLLDKITYIEKYLLTVEDYQTRLIKNPNQIYIVKDSNNILAGYLSMVPLQYYAYERIKNGETDKEVINFGSIIGLAEKIEYVYWDSIVINPVYRRQKLGKKLLSYGMKDLIKNNPEIKRIMAHTISKGGTNLAQKYGLEIKKNLNETTVVVEKAFSRKSNKRKRLYRNKNKRFVQVYKFNTNNNIY